MFGLNRLEFAVLLLCALVLLALALPWFLHTREDSRLHQCNNNLREIGVALKNYHSFQGEYFPYGTLQAEELPPDKRLAWTVTAATLMQPKAAFNFVFFAPWDSETNRQPTVDGNPFHRNRRFHCPADDTDSPPDRLQYSSYVGMSGVGKETLNATAADPANGVWGYHRQTNLEQITDGKKFTICVLETSRDNGPWTAGGPPTLRALIPQEKPFLGSGLQFGGHHAEGCMILFADGSVSRLSNETAPDVVTDLCTIAAEKRTGKTAPPER